MALKKHKEPEHQADTNRCSHNDPQGYALVRVNRQSEECERNGYFSDAGRPDIDALAQPPPLDRPFSISTVCLGI